MRIGREKYFGIWSLGFVFLFQGLLSWWISLPVAFAQSLNWLPTAYGFQWNIVTVIGLLVWVVGFSFETIGDRQLVQFKKNPDNRGKVMDQGLWKYTRHPNYFGDACLWWGFWIMSVGASGEFWFLTLLTVLSPVTMTFFLLNVSGVSMLEKDIGSRRPKYSDYIQKTSAFFPWPPKK
jgi:steroid 5-alpha reductase family enzyme